jgi:hypothetical protein
VGSGQRRLAGHRAFRGDAANGLAFSPDARGSDAAAPAAAPEYYRRRRRIFYTALKYAVRERQLPANPLDGADDPGWKAPEISGAVDRRRVVYGGIWLHTRERGDSGCGQVSGHVGWW